MNRKTAEFIRLLHELSHRPEAAPPPAVSSESTGLYDLRAWQSRRLEACYADLLARTEMGPACRFFLTDIYGPQDFSRRDADFDRLHEILARHLPAQNLDLMARTIRLNRFSHALDERLFRVHEAQFPGAPISAESYAAAYRISASVAERQEQIEQLGAVIVELGTAAHQPLVGIGLRLARRPAERAGWHAVYDFLQRGRAAFLPMKDAAAFARVICRRETVLMRRLFSAEPDPFRRID